MTLPRTIEPELMDDPDESRSYDAMDHREVNRRFVEDFLSICPSPEGMQDRIRILDLGTGSAQIPIELAVRCEACNIVASDFAASMLNIARQNIVTAGLQNRIEVHYGDSKQLEFEAEVFDCVISNSLLHHLANPQLAVAEMLRVVKPKGTLFVRDLMRPQSSERVESLVTTYAGGETAYNQQLLRQSLHAALTLDEARRMVEDVGCEPGRVQPSSDRHWTWAARKR